MKRRQCDGEVDIVGLGGERALQHCLRHTKTLARRLIDRRNRLRDDNFGIAVGRAAGRGRRLAGLQEPVEAARHQIACSRGKPRLLELHVRLVDVDRNRRDRLNLAGGRLDHARAQDPRALAALQ
ncbi:hypothetical protein [Bradyrhizobium sp. AZCC 2289]|uniref:hypothetical protein n=1 Tax=Bradyrhizobium sp. AZCC 2289 TaxID=3117026 RepID=UPI002FEF77D4